MTHETFYYLHINKKIHIEKGKGNLENKLIIQKKERKVEENKYKRANCSLLLQICPKTAQVFKFLKKNNYMVKLFFVKELLFR